MNPEPVLQECPSCRKRLRVPASAFGKKVKCPKCSEPFTIAGPAPIAVPLPIPVPPQPAGDPFDFDANDDRPAPTAKEPSAEFFTVVEPRTWSMNRVYRIYPDGDELIGVWAGSGNELALGAAAGGGLIGGLIGGVLAASAAKKNAKRLEAMEGKPLAELRRSHPKNFVLATDDIDSAEIVRPSFWFRVNHTSVPQIAILNLSGTESKRLALATAQDLGTAITLLESVLGDRLDVKVKHRR